MREPILTPPSHQPAARWTGRDLAAALGLLLLGYAVVIAVVVALASVGDPDLDPNIALAVAFVTLGFEIWLGAIVLILATRRDLTLPQLGFRALRGNRWWWIGAAVGGAYGIVIGYSLLLVGIEAVTGADLGRLREGNSIPDSAANTRLVWAVLGASVVLAAPFGEELFFRALLFRALASRWGLVAGMLLSGAIFALVHFEVSVALPFWGVGIWFAWTYHRSGSLWTTIAAHAIFNGLSFLATVVGMST